MRRHAMQMTARDHWANVASNEGIPDPLGDFGWWTGWDYVRDTCDVAIWLKILPRAGGLDDQDPLWVADLKQYQAGLNRARYEADPDSFWGSLSDTPDIQSADPLNLPNWLNSYG